VLRWKTSLPTRRRRAVTEPTNSLVHLLVTCKLINLVSKMGQFSDTRRFGGGVDRSVHFT